MVAGRVAGSPPPSNLLADVNDPSNPEFAATQGLPAEVMPAHSADLTHSLMPVMAKRKRING